MNVNARFLSYQGSVSSIDASRSPVVAQYFQIIASLRTSLSERELGLFAQPVWDEMGRPSGWRSRSGNPLSKICELPASKRCLLLEQHDRTFRRIEDLIETMEVRGGPESFVSRTLKALLEAPRPEQNLFTDGDGPVLINWLHIKDEKAAEATPVRFSIGGFDAARLTSDIAQQPELALIGQSARITVPHSRPGSDESITQTNVGDCGERKQGSQAKVHLAARALVTLTGAAALAVFILEPDGARLGPTLEEPGAIGSLALTSELAPTSERASEPDLGDKSPPTLSAMIRPAAVDEAPAALSTTSENVSAKRMPPAPQSEHSDPFAAGYSIAQMLRDPPASASPTHTSSTEIARVSVTAPSTPLSGNAHLAAQPNGVTAMQTLPEPLRPPTPAVIAYGGEHHADEGREPMMVAVLGATTDLGKAKIVPKELVPAPPLAALTEDEINTLIHHPEPLQSGPELKLAAQPETSTLPAKLTEGSDASAIGAWRVEHSAREHGVEPENENEADVIGTANLAAIELDLGMSRRDRVELQRRLKLLGFDPRGIDGIFGPRTRSAVSQWQRSVGEMPTGYFDARSLSKIETQSARAYAHWQRHERQRAKALAKAKTERAKRAQKITSSSRKLRRFVDRLLSVLAL